VCPVIRVSGIRVLREQAKILGCALALFDLATAIVAYLCALHLSVAGAGTVGFIGLLPILLPGIAFSAIVHLLGGYRSFRAEALLNETRLIAESAVLTGVLISVSQAFQPTNQPRLSQAAWFLMLTFLWVSLGRAALRLALRALRRGGYNLRYYLIAGTGERAQEIAQELTSEGYWGIQVLGYVLPSATAQCSVLPESVLGTIEDLDEILQRQIVDRILFPAGEIPEVALHSALECCQRLGIEAFLDLRPLQASRELLGISELAGSPLLAIGQTRLHQYHARLKRLFDLAIAAAALVIFAPLLLIIALLIKASTGGPVLFRQIRVGVNGRRFVMLKFRTMIENAEHLRAAVAPDNEMDGPVFKLRNDPRITWLGHYLRKTSLDELPQLWNVLWGDMSLVGPRPPLPEEVMQYQGWQRRRLCVRPGLTCLWQVSGRNRVNFDTWMKLDLDYIDHWSWWLDLKILLRTVPAMLRGQ
jgi:exopolysaccharide biosynthesis polyprenyl glycosylphosphotransferase